MKKKQKIKPWAPDKIYLTRDGWNNASPDDSEILWSENRICKSDVCYRRVRRITKGARR